MSRLKDYLNHNEMYPDEHELEMIAKLARQEKEWKANVGFRVDRTEHNPVEKAFHDQWMKENEPVAGYNCGNGILQDLFIESDGHPFSAFNGRKTVEVITDRDRMIVATVIQWLGSNVGQGFLYEALRRVKGSIVYERKEVELK